MIAMEKVKLGEVSLRDMPVDAELFLASTYSDISLSSSTSSLDLKKTYVPASIVRSLNHQGLLVDDAGKVIWDETSKHHPRNWHISRKCYDTALICFLEFLMTMVSNTGSTTAGQVYGHFDVSRKTALLCFTFSYLSGQALGGLFLPPISETFGGQAIYVVTTALFALGNIIIGAFPQLLYIIIARFLTGFFSAMPGTVAAGSLENMWDVRSRIWVIHLWIVTAVAGLASGPVVSTYIGYSHLGWRWVYMILGLVSAGAAICCLAMRESRPSKILRQRVRAVERSTGFQGLSTAEDQVTSNFRSFCHDSLLLPVRLFFTEPIVMLTSIMAASVYAIIYVFPEVLPVVYNEFQFSNQQISLVNLAVAVSIPLTFLPRLLDIRQSNKQKRMGREPEPEDKITGFILAAPCLAVSFWIFAAAIPPLQRHITPWISISCLVGVGFSTIEFDNVLSGYLTDSYSSHAASANAPMAFLRASLSGLFPLFAGDILNVLTANEFMFLLAGLASFYCLVAMWFAKYGKIYREKSKFATRITQCLAQPCTMARKTEVRDLV